jgi:hypothetical protein
MSVDNAIITADNACYQAKKNSRNQYYLAKHDNLFIKQRLVEMGWVHKVKEAVKNNHFTSHFQFLNLSTPTIKKYY